MDDLFVSGKLEQKRRKESLERGDTSQKVAHRKWRTVVTVAKTGDRLNHGHNRPPPATVAETVASPRPLASTSPTKGRRPSWPFAKVSSDNAKGADEVVGKLQETLQLSDRGSKGDKPKKLKRLSLLRKPARSLKSRSRQSGVNKDTSHREQQLSQRLSSAMNLHVQRHIEELGSSIGSHLEAAGEAVSEALHLKQLGAHLEHLTEHVGTSFFSALKLHEHPSLAHLSEPSVASHVQLGLHVASSLQEVSSRPTPPRPHCTASMDSRLRALEGLASASSGENWSSV